MRGAIGPHHSSPQYPQQPTFVPETQIVLPPFAPAVESAQQTQSAAQEQQQLQGQQNQLQLMQTPNQLGYDMNGFIWMGGSVGFPGSFSVPPPSNSTSLMAHVNMSQSYSLPRMNFSACETPVGVNMGPYDFHAAFAATRQDQIQIQPQQQTEYQQAALTIPVAKVEPGGESPSTEPSTSSANADVAQQPWSDSVSPEIEPAETVGPELTVLLEGIPMLNPVVDFGTDLFEDPMFWDI
ncbi:hypothetical protein BC830DRAFT_1175369 [Chytriomyces sp. MP71]|nr:hypothetical protein BC830DRAFT_1175369 [Chytriomyces sp. MP71]